MFDIGFLEILVIFVLGLVVIGPDRLPSTIKTCAIWFSRFKRSIQDARTEFEQQIGADEIRREIHNQQILDSMRDLGDARKSFEDKVNNMKDELLADEESQNAAGIEQETSPDKNREQSDSVDTDSAGTPAAQSDIESKPDNNEQQEEKTVQAEDKPHEPMIHDDSGEDASAIPGRLANQDEAPLESTQKNETDGKQ